jgi:mRNA-degrading endonuclease RelE of RelBE toxin-antitoxin system
VVLARGVNEQLEAVSATSREQVLTALNTLMVNPQTQDKGRPILHGSVDAGGYRIGYAVNSYEKTVLVGAIFPVPTN